MRTGSNGHIYPSGGGRGGSHCSDSCEALKIDAWGIASTAFRHFNARIRNLSQMVLVMGGGACCVAALGRYRSVRA